MKLGEAVSNQREIDLKSGAGWGIPAGTGNKKKGETMRKIDSIDIHLIFKSYGRFVFYDKWKSGRGMCFSIDLIVFSVTIFVFFKVGSKGGS